MKDPFKTICDIFDLGIPSQEPIAVQGGLLHTMWRLDTSKSSFAVKQLSEKIDLENKAIVKNYNLSEKIASLFIERGIPAVSAIAKEGEYLIVIDSIGYLIYPWVEARALEQHEVSELNALKIAEILAVMHNCHLDIPEIAQPRFDTHSSEVIAEWIDRFCSLFSSNIKSHQAIILSANKDFQTVIPILESDAVVCHGDLDQKNVLWDKNNSPILIDWESARKLNPTYEIVNASFDWSGISSHFDKDLFIKMIRTYENAGGMIDSLLFQASFYGVQGNWIHWLIYNLERSCCSKDPEQKAMGLDQVEKTVATILRLQGHFDF